MATEAALIARIRSELGDFTQPFRTTYRGDGVTDLFDLPATNVSGIVATLINNNVPTVLSPTPGSALTTPVNAAFTTATTGGTLPAGVKSYRVAATNQYGSTLASVATTITTTGATSTVTVNWGAVTGASGYKVYGRTAGSELLIATVGAVLTYTDTGAITPAGALPTLNNTYSGYLLDVREGLIDLVTPPPEGSTLMVEGSSTGLFTDAELAVYLHDAVLQHTHGASARVRYRDADGFIKYQERPVTLSTLPEVEELLVVILASVEALWALSTDASTDVDISTAEGTFIPRSQRYAQIRSQIDVLTEKYTDLSQQLNVGLHRIEMSDLRRVSRTTGRLVPLYVTREFDDYSWPERIIPPIDSRHSEGDRETSTPLVGDDPQTVDITLTAGDSFSMDLDFEFDLTGSTIVASSSGSTATYGSTARQYFTVVVTNAALGLATLSLLPGQTARLPRYAAYDVQVTNSVGVITTYIRGRIYINGQITPDGSVFFTTPEFNAWNIPGWTVDQP